MTITRWFRKQIDVFFFDLLLKSILVSITNDVNVLRQENARTKRTSEFIH